MPYTELTYKITIFFFNLTETIVTHVLDDVDISIRTLEPPA